MPKTTSVPVIEELLELKKQLEPLETKFDQAKESARAIGPETYQIPGKGTVKVSEPVEKKPKGTQVVLDAEKLEAANQDLKARLFELGILKTETAYTRASKAKVEVRLEAA